MKTRRSWIPALSRAEIEALHRPANRALRRAYLDCLSGLGELLAHHARSGFSIQIPEMDDAVRYFEDAYRRIEGAEPYHARISRSLEAYRAVRRMVEELGYSDELWDLVDSLRDRVTEQYGEIVNYPRVRGAQERPLRSATG